MSDWRNKAREIKAAGEAERGNFTPHGTPARIYNYWLLNSASNKAFDIRIGDRRENFCHFWRVVLIWAGLLRVGIAIHKVIDWMIHSVAVGISFVVLAVGFFGWGLFHMGILWQTVLVILASLAVIVLIVGIVLGISYLHDEYWNSDWNKYVSNAVFGLIGFVCVSYVVFLFVMLCFAIGWWAPVVVAVAAGAIALMAWGVSNLITYISGRRALAREAARRARADALDKFYRGEGPHPDTFEPREPTWLNKILSGIADFLILSAQIVRVKKWKICPFVDVNTSKI